jgi:hypothetical protein
MIPKGLVPSWPEALQRFSRKAGWGITPTGLLPLVAEQGPRPSQPKTYGQDMVKAPCRFPKSSKTTRPGVIRTHDQGIMSPLL